MECGACGGGGGGVVAILVVAILRRKFETRNFDFVNQRRVRANCSSVFWRGRNRIFSPAASTVMAVVAITGADSVGVDGYVGSVVMATLLLGLSSREASSQYSPKRIPH